MYHGRYLDAISDPLSRADPCSATDIRNERSEEIGWVGRTRTYTLRYQKAVHYHYATTQLRAVYAAYSESARPKMHLFLV